MRTRALRISSQLEKEGVLVSLEEIEADIQKRDELDKNRENSPLIQAEDAVLVDSSEMTIDEVVETILTIYRQRECT